MINEGRFVWHNVSEKWYILRYDKIHCLNSLTPKTISIPRTSVKGVLYVPPDMIIITERNYSTEYEKFEKLNTVIYRIYIQIFGLLHSNIWSFIH